MTCFFCLRADLLGRGKGYVWKAFAGKRREAIPDLQFSEQMSILARRQDTGVLP